MDKIEKSYRILDILWEIQKGKNIDKRELIEKYSITSRSIDRDIADIKSFFQEQGIEIYFNKSKKTYEMKNEGSVLDKKKILGVVKVLLESRAFTTKKITSIVNNLLEFIDKKDRKEIESIINNEFKNYISLNDNSDLLYYI